MSKLITYAYMKEETDISQVLDPEKLDNPIKRAQSRLSALIGVEFYNELDAQNTGPTKTFTPENLAFFDPCVKRYLAWQAYYLYLAGSNSFDTRTGRRTFKEDNSDPATDKIMGELLSLANKDVLIHQDNMINFLASAKKVSSAAYPLYTLSGCGTSQRTGFGITSVSKFPTTNYKIDRQVRTQEP